MYLCVCVRACIRVCMHTIALVHTFLCMCMHTCHDVLSEIRGQFMGVSFVYHVGSMAGTKPRDKSPYPLSHPPSPVTFKISTHCVWGTCL